MPSHRAPRTLATRLRQSTSYRNAYLARSLMRIKGMDTCHQIRPLDWPFSHVNSPHRTIFWCTRCGRLSLQLALFGTSMAVGKYRSWRVCSYPPARTASAIARRRQFLENLVPQLQCPDRALAARRSQFYEILAAFERGLPPALSGLPVPLTLNDNGTTS